MRAYTYLHARSAATGLRHVAENAVLNANYLQARLKDDYTCRTTGSCMHEFVLRPDRHRQAPGIRALDIAKRLIDHGFHPPTIYFPLIVDEAMMIEPTETESRETLDAFADASARVAAEAATAPEISSRRR